MATSMFQSGLAAIVGLVLVSGFAGCACPGDMAGGAKVESPAPLAFNIPQMSGVVIDGKSGDWADGGLAVDMLAPTDGAMRPTNQFDSHMRLGWDARGLLVLLDVVDTTPMEEENPALLFAKDSVELFLADGRGGKQAVQVVVTPGIDPKQAEPRVKIFDHRNDEALKKADYVPQFARVKNAKGYTMEVLLPWKELGIKPEMGRRVSFQINVNDNFADGKNQQVLWYPSGGAWNDNHMMQELVLAKEPSPAATIAMQGNYEKLADVKVRLIARATMAGRLVEVSQGSVVAGRVAMTGAGEFATGVLVLPMPARGKDFASLTASLDGKPRAMVELPDIEQVRKQTFAAARPRFGMFVFSGSTFPSIAYDDPQTITQAAGDVALTAKFYDGEGKQVTEPTYVGRYGAIVEAKPQTGEPRTFMYTLVKMDPAMAAKVNKAKTVDEFLANWKLTPAMLAEQDRFFSRAPAEKGMADFIGQPSSAVLIAGLTEYDARVAAGTKPAAFQFHLDAGLPDRAWWYNVRKAMGKFPVDYLVTMPPNFDKARKEPYPLIVFLHGSGAVESVLADDVKGMKDFPFIILGLRGNEGWTPQAVKACIDDAMSRYNIDANRIYLTGYSMGGFGSWDTLVTYPGLFAAAAPICGGGTPAAAATIKNVPIWIFHGDADTSVNINYSREMFAALKAVGAEVEFTVYPGVGHDSWTQTYTKKDLFDWFLKHTKGAKATTNPTTAPK